MTDIINARN